MPVSSAFQVAKGGFTRLAGQAATGTPAYVAALGRELSTLARRFSFLSAELSPDVLTLADDEAAYIEFTVSASRAVAVFVANAAAGGCGTVAFRVGGLAFASLLSSVGATVTVGTGTLDGTTGVDGQLTIYADSATNRLYVENRTGGARTYGFSFVGAIGTVKGTWVTV